MVSKNKVKSIRQLQQKKYRAIYGNFVVEGIKGIQEFLHAGFQCDELFTVDKNMFLNEDAQVVDIQTLSKMSSLQSPADSLAVFRIPKKEIIDKKGLIVALDAIRDPGNLGTIIRLCDWFSVKHIICSLDTVDCYNPKVIRATVGSLARVNVHYRLLNDFLVQTSLPVYGATTTGKSIYTTSVHPSSVLVLGNEGQGISTKIKKILDHEISIPSYENGKTESLNVAMAAGILIGEIKRTIEK